MPQLRRDVRTAITARPDAPQISLKSPFAGRAHMGDIIVEGDPFFVRHGSIIIERGAIELYRFISDGERLNPPQIKVQTSGTLWDQNDRINVWVWSRTGDTISMEIFLNVDIRPIPPTSAVLPPNRAELLQFAPDNNPLKNTAQTFIEWLRDRLDEITEPDLRTDLTAFTSKGFDLTARDAMVPRLDGYPDIRDRLAALHESLPIPDYTGSAMFPLKRYFNEDHARLVHMRGARNAVLILTHDPADGPTPGPTETRGLPVGGGFDYTIDPSIAPDGSTDSYSSNVSALLIDRQIWRLNPSILPWSVSLAVSLSTTLNSTPSAIAEGGQWRLWQYLPTTATRTLTVEGGPSASGPWTALGTHSDPAPTADATTSYTFAIGATDFEYFRASGSIVHNFTVRDRGLTRREPDTLNGRITIAAKRLSSMLTQRGVRPGYPPQIRLELKGPDGDWAELAPYVIFPGDPTRSGSAVIMEGESHFYGQDLGNSVLPTGPDILRLRLKATAPFVDPFVSRRTVRHFPPDAHVVASLQTLA